MNQIKFSHQYEKMPDDVHLSTALLLEVLSANSVDLSEIFTLYDTKIKGKEDFYKLPRGKLLILLLLSGNRLWTTIRRQTDEKEVYYRSLRGQQVEIVISKVP